jgi:hypothetical protein
LSLQRPAGNRSVVAWAQQLQRKPKTTLPTKPKDPTDVAIKAKAWATAADAL